MIYYSYFHSVMNYGLIFWENSSYTNSIFKIQQRIIRIIMGTGTRHSCRELFKIPSILPLHYSYFHSVMNYGLIFWENSSYTNSNFKIQKRIIRIIMGTGTRHSSRELFKILNILPLHSQYISSLMLFVV